MPRFQRHECSGHRRGHPSGRWYRVAVLFDARGAHSNHDLLPRRRAERGSRTDPAARARAPSRPPTAPQPAEYPAGRTPRIADCRCQQKSAPRAASSHTMSCHRRTGRTSNPSTVSQEMLATDAAAGRGEGRSSTVVVDDCAELTAVALTKPARRRPPERAALRRTPGTARECRPTECRPLASSAPSSGSPDVLAASGGTG